jgi:hypothetical protein
MQVKDRVVTWYIQNVVMPGRIILDKPGFIVTTFTEKNVTTYLRELFFSEQLLESIEKSIAQQYGEPGKKALYSAGKKFGYLYASMSNFPTIKTSTQKELEEFAYLFVRFCEGTFAQKADHTLDFEKKIITISFDDYIICRHNGLGQIMTEGGTAGIWAYIIQDKTIEGIQFECQGRGDKQCLLVCAPEKYLLEKTVTIFHETELPECTSDDFYKAINEIKELNNSNNSLRALLDIGFFQYSKGIISYKADRFFDTEISLIYLLEEEISKLHNGEQILFDICVEYGKHLREIYGGTDYQKFLSDFFPSLGFGEIVVTDFNNPSITAIYYPWTIFSEKSKYIIFRGIMSGFISSSLGKNIRFTHFTTDIKTYLTVTITE